MISAGDLRKGTTFEFDGQVFTVTDFLFSSTIIRATTLQMRAINLYNPRTPDSLE